MKKIKFLFGFLLVILVLFVSFGHFSLPSPKGLDSDDYSAASAAKSAFAATAIKLSALASFSP